MKMRTLVITTVALLCATLGGCYPGGEPKTGTQTNWLRACVSDADCGGNSCRCGTCSHSCTTDMGCGDLPGASCVAATDAATIALCDGNPPATALCLPRCTADSGCSSEQSCVAGVCRAPATATAQLVVDLNLRFQPLTGLGATLAYAEADVTQYADTDTLYATMFAELGLDALRLRNRYGYTGDDELASAATIVDAAKASLGHRPTVILASWSPPASLKANGSTSCHGDQDTCTLARLSTGGFDYDAYAGYWRDSMEAYAAVGIAPDYIAIQNNPDFVPPTPTPGEGCRFLPTQSSLPVTVDGSARVLEFPGYDRAIKAVLKRLQGLSAMPKIIAPEASVPSLVDSYVQHLDASEFDAIGHHLYGSNPVSPDLATLRRLNELAQATGRPAFQTEMVADGLGTAVLLHHTLVTEGGAAYLHNALVAPTADSGALVVIDGSELKVQPAYHALRHFARFTDPGWIRVASESSQAQLLASSWLSPTGAATVVIVNSGDDPFDVELDIDLGAASRTRVTRTAFDGTERSADLGNLPHDRILRSPGHSIVTIAFDAA